MRAVHDYAVLDFAEVPDYSFSSDRRACSYVRERAQNCTFSDPRRSFDDSPSPDSSAFLNRDAASYDGAPLNCSID